jgi:hypothetical protein
MSILQQVLTLAISMDIIFWVSVKPNKKEGETSNGPSVWKNYLLQSITTCLSQHIPIHSSLYRFIFSAIILYKKLHVKFTSLNFFSKGEFNIQMDQL